MSIINYITQNAQEYGKEETIVRLMHSGSQPIPTSLILRWHKKFPNILYDTNYGLTEATGLGCIHLGVENIDKTGAIGKPDARWSAKIVNNDGVSVERGIVGELIINCLKIFLFQFISEVFRMFLGNPKNQK